MKNLFLVLHDIGSWALLDESETCNITAANCSVDCNDLIISIWWILIVLGSISLDLYFPTHLPIGDPGEYPANKRWLDVLLWKVQIYYH